MPLTPVTVTGQFLLPDRTPAKGTVEFRLVTEGIDPADGLLVPTAPAVATLDTTGAISVQLYATDDPKWAQTGLSYVVTEKVTGAKPARSPYLITLPANTPGGTVKLSSLTPLQQPPAAGIAYETAAGAQAKADAARSASLPIGGGTLTGPLRLASTAAGGLDATDSTSRVTVESYQTNGNNFFGEGVRLDLMRSMSKNMLAWRLPRPPTSTDTTTLRSVTWVGAHYHSQIQPDPNNPTDVHGHWSVETPNAADNLITRFEIKFVGQNGQIGSDKTLIQTSASDLVVDCSAGQVLRLRTGAGAGKFIEYGNDMWGAAPRWMLGSPGSPESGGNAGSDFVLQRFSDAGVSLGAPIMVSRSTGRLMFGGADGSQSGVDINRSTAGTALNVNTNYPTGTGVVGYAHTAFEATSRSVQLKITTDANSRLVIFADGKHEWGDGTAARDTNLYRTAAATLKTDQSLHVGATLRHLGASLGFYNSAAVAKPSITGSRGGNAALASLLTSLATLGLVTDTTTA